MTTQSNPTLNGACNWSNRVKAEWKKFPPQLGSFVGYKIVPVKGAIVTEHHLYCNYEHGYTVHDGKTTSVVMS